MTRSITTTRKGFGTTWKSTSFQKEYPPSSNFTYNSFGFGWKKAKILTTSSTDNIQFFEIVMQRASHLHATSRSSFTFILRFQKNSGISGLAGVYLTLKV